MEDPERFPEMFPDFMAGCRDTISSDLAELRVEDLPGVVLRSSEYRPVLRKIFLELVVERYEVEIELFNSQEISYEFRDPRAFLESLPPPKREEIPLLFEIQEEEDPILKIHFEDALENAEIEAAQDVDSLPVMAGQKQDSVHQVFVDPMAEYMEALIFLNAPTLIPSTGQIH